jgi:hypothetical protein
VKAMKKNAIEISRPARKLLLLVWAMRYEWVLCAIGAYAIVQLQSLLLFALTWGLMLLVSLYTPRLFSKYFQERTPE